jgi:hypothetical protein
MIVEDLALHFLPNGKILRFRLALATKPFDIFFLCEIPTRHEDNTWNQTNLHACEMAKTRWTQATSGKEKGVEAYEVSFAKESDAFPEPNWLTTPLDDIIGITFTGRTIDREDHPALLRLIGAKPKVS